MPIEKDLYDSPADHLAVHCPDLVDQLGQLDDLVFEAIAGRPGAIDRLRIFWPEVRGMIGAALAEESREQYMRHALRVWQDCISNEEIRNPALAISVMEVMALLFRE